MGKYRGEYRKYKSRRGDEDTVWGLTKYHPYRIHGERNPKFDATSGRLLDFKDEADRNHEQAVKLYAGVVVDKLQQLVRRQELIYLAIVPSHERDKVSDALLELFDMVREHYNVLNDVSPLRRHTTIDKLATGGDRAKRVHIDSIELTDNSCRGHEVLLLDDICTTENSIKACADLLLSAGATSVIKFVLAKTVTE